MQMHEKSGLHNITFLLIAAWIVAPSEGAAGGGCSHADMSSVAADQ